MKTSRKVYKNNVMERLYVCWRDYCPQLRFMQFINCFQTWKGSDCFYMTDEQLMDDIKKFCKEFLNNQKRELIQCKPLSKNK